jgi:hypothetical protein
VTFVTPGECDAVSLLRQQEDSRRKQDALGISSQPSRTERHRLDQARIVVLDVADPDASATCINRYMQPTITMPAEPRNLSRLRGSIPATFIVTGISTLWSSWELTRVK